MNEDFREDLKKACEVMQKGGVILYPTDTIWGIGCDATEIPVWHTITKPDIAAENFVEFGH